jgi:hypothetical protein
MDTFRIVRKRTLGGNGVLESDLFLKTKLFLHISSSV